MTYNKRAEGSRYEQTAGEYLEEQGYYGDYIRKAYSDAEIDELGAYLTS